MTNRSGSSRRVSIRIAVVAVLGLLAGGVVAGVSRHRRTERDACESRTNNTYEKVLECLRVEGVREHQAALQAIADANGALGLPAAGTDGYTGSVDYVVDTLEAAGYRSRSTSSPSVLSRPPLRAVDPGGADVRDRCVHRLRVRRGDRERDPGRHQPGPAAGTTSGCEAADFAGSTSAAPPTSP